MSAGKLLWGAIQYSEIYKGEIQDARSESELVRKQETFKPLKIITSTQGNKIIDSGQNLVAWVVVRLKGNAGDKLAISHAEVLDNNRNFYTKNLRTAKQQNIYILKSGIEETFEPHFTWQGFRFIKVEGVEGNLRPESFTAVALYSDMERPGNFTSSNPLLNQLQHNIEWGQKGNFIDIPIDCPQRERLGWTGDAQAFARTAAYNMKVHSFFTKWLKHLAADQLPNGIGPPVTPNTIREYAVGWADASIIIPWASYRAYGDKKILSDRYSSMKAWVRHIEQIRTGYLWNKGFQFSDWLFYRPADDLDGRSAVTDKYLIAQCFFANSVQLLINTATVLNKKEDALQYSNLLTNIKEAFLKEYITPSGQMVSGTQTAYTLALNFDKALKKQTS